VSRLLFGTVVTWLCLVSTADEQGAGTDANVQLVIYGKNDKGESVKSDEVKLDNSGDNFESGQQDQFKIETIDVGRPYKIRIWHDNAGSFAAWKLDRVSQSFSLFEKTYETKQKHVKSHVFGFKKRNNVKS